MSWLFDWAFSRDRLGRLRCGNCGLCCTKQMMDYGDEGIEVQYVCIHCFAKRYEAWIPEEFANELYPDWNKRWRDKLKAERARRKKALKDKNKAFYLKTKRWKEQRKVDRARQKGGVKLKEDYIPPMGTALFCELNE